MKYSIVLFLFAFFSSGFAQTTKHDYNLFRPTPKEQMRGFETDRPDATESAYTVDAGHFQLESNMFLTDRSSADGVRTIQNTFNGFNLKLGITNSLDIQFVAETYVSTRIFKGTSSRTNSSFRNITFRAKQNIWGNDSGKTALSILPYINIPTTQNIKITGGLVIPLAISLANDWGFGSQFESDIVTNQTGNGTHLNYLFTATVSHAIFSKFDFFTEALLSRETDMKSFEYFLNGGLVYEVKENFKLDTGLYYGLKKTSSKVVFIGLSFRF